MAELSRIHWDSLGAGAPSYQAIHRSQAHLEGLGWGSSIPLLPRVLIYRGYRGYEPQGDGWEEWSIYRYELLEA